MNLAPNKFQERPSSASGTQTFSGLGSAADPAGVAPLDPLAGGEGISFPSPFPKKRTPPVGPVSLWPDPK